MASSQFNKRPCLPNWGGKWLGRGITYNSKYTYIPPRIPCPLPYTPTLRRKIDINFVHVWKPCKETHYLVWLIYTTKRISKGILVVLNWDNSTLWSLEDKTQHHKAFFPQCLAQDKKQGKQLMSFWPRFHLLPVGLLWFECVFPFILINNPIPLGKGPLVHAPSLLILYTCCGISMALKLVTFFYLL